MDIKYLKDCLEETKSAYRSSKNNLLWLEQYRLENQNYRDYEGREILELLQNADDAQSDSVDIQLYSKENRLVITNHGEKTRVFTEEGMRSIMASYLSPKKNGSNNNSRLIGAKGLGFKSILNWASKIAIKSDNVLVRFGDDVVRKFWEELRPIISSPKEYEIEARKDGHVVPLPILRIPEIIELSDYESNSTSIELTYYSEKVNAKIIEALKNFSPESLLFLHNLRNIRIVVDGKERTYCLKTVSDKNGIEICDINGQQWLVSHEDGEIGGRNYEVAAAFSLDANNRRPSYNVFTFFPTDEEFPFPCIIHATLELNASRKAILTDEEINSKMMPLVADRVIALADAVKSRSHNWDAYNIVNGQFTGRNFHRYVSKLKSALTQKTTAKEYIPILQADKYVNANDCYYYNDTFFDFVTNNYGAGLFKNMRLSGAPEGFQDKHDENAKNHIESIAVSITDYSSLAKFIKIVYDYYSQQGVKDEIAILKDDKGVIIHGTAYLNTGRKIANIPDFKKIKYVNDDLKKALLEEFGKTGQELEQVRAIAKDLNDSITRVSQSDVSGIKGLLALSSTNKSYEPQQIEQIIECLFNLYVGSPDEFKKSNIECYLPTEDDGWRPAKELIFGDRRFPEGFKNLNLSSTIYKANDYVKFPDSLIATETEKDDIIFNQIQDFYEALGVRRYFQEKEVCYGVDKEYLQLNNISKETIDRASSQDVSSGVNIIRVPENIEKWNSLKLTDLILLIRTSGLISKIVDNTTHGLWWYYSRWHGPEPLGINYISYLLRNWTMARKLSNFVISIKEWIADPESDFNYDDKDDSVILLLKILGAKSSLSDFSPHELYDLINAKAKKYRETKDASGIKEFYHRIKVAFVAMGGDVKLPDDVDLSMLCEYNGQPMLMDSRKIFYSNNGISEKLRSQLPILSLQLRDGEDEVNRFFGCRRVKDLEVLLIEQKKNERLQRELNELLQKCKPFILATISKDSRDGATYDNDKKSLVERIMANVVNSVTYCYEYNNIKTGEEKLKNGDLIFVDKQPMICCNANSINDALADPRFCNSVAEAICVFLNLSYRENNDKFYRLIKSTDRELEYLKDGFNSGLWQSCQEAFGISDRELDFWKQVFDVNGKSSDFDITKIKEGKSAYIAEHLCISLYRANVANFKQYHMQKLRAERDKYVIDYKISLYQKLSGNQEKEKLYLGKIADFQSDDWIHTALDSTSAYLIAPDYNVVMLTLLNSLFDFHPETIQRSQSVVVPEPMQYDYDGMELNIEDESLLYFEGNEDYFRRLKEKHAVEDIPEKIPSPNEDSTEEDGNDENYNSAKISIINTKKKAESTSQNKVGNRRGNGKTRRKMSDSELKKIGNKAEDKVLAALQAEGSEYEVVTIYSKHLNPDSGNDAQGYDLEYRRKGDEITRCLEIKHFTGTSIIVSRHEYEVSRSKECRGRYDVALVNGNDIQIWENAFSDESKYSIIADDYTISFEVADTDIDSNN